VKEVWKGEAAPREAPLETPEVDDDSIAAPLPLPAPPLLLLLAAPPKLPLLSVEEVITSLAGEGG